LNEFPRQRESVEVMAAGVTCTKRMVLKTALNETGLYKGPNKNSAYPAKALLDGV